MNDGVPVCPLAVQCPQPELCPLSRIEAGRAVRIRQLDASPEINHRLRELGFCEDTQIKVVSCQTSFICQVCRTRIGISQELAGSILVERISVPA